MSIIHNKDIKSPGLRAYVVEPILLSCIDGVTNYELEPAIQTMLPLSNITIKEYLFYLIDYELVSYNGQKQIFSIEYGGFGLLDMIDEVKRQEKIDIDDLQSPLNMMLMIKTIYDKN